MRRAWTILKREYVERVRQRSFLLGTLLVPVFILGVTFVPMWLAARPSGRPIHLVVADWTQSLKGRIESVFPDSLSDRSPRFRFDWVDLSPGMDARTLLDRLQKQVLAEEYTGILWVPADALSGGAADFYALSAADPEIGLRLRQALSRAALMQRLVNRGIAADEIDEVSRPVSLNTFKITKEGARKGGFETEFVSTLLFAMILYMTILLYGLSVQRSILEDKTSRIVEVLLASARPFHLMLGKILGVGGVGLTQYAIWAAVGLAGGAYVKSISSTFATAAAIPVTAWIFFVIYFLLGFLLYAGLYAAIGAMVTSEQESQQLQWPVTTIVMIPIILMITMMRDPDGTTSVVLSLIPFFSPILMMMRIILHTPPFWQIACSLALMVGAIVGVAALAGRIFRVGILMYGKRATLPEIIRWIRAG